MMKTLQLDLHRVRCTLQATVVLAGVLLAGCGESPADLLKSARDYQARNDHPAAIIQLKNVLQKQPDNGEARLLLGQSSLVVGDPTTAEKEFRKAGEYGQPAAVVMPLIAKAMLESGEVDKLVAEFRSSKLDDPKADAAVRASVGLAQLRMGKFDDAAASFAEALHRDPSNLQAQLGQVRLLAFKGQADEAAAAMTRIVAAHPQSADALLLQGTLRIAQGDRSGARTSLEAAIAADPSWAPARLELIALLIVDSQFDAATEQIDAARKLRGQDLRLVYFDALVAMGRKDLPKARELSAQLLKSAPDHVPTLVLAGSLESEQKQWVAAEAHLQKALLLAPEHDGARRALVRAYMSTNQAARALDTVQPLLAPGRRVDPATLMLAGEVYLANGDIRQASTYFASATESKPQETAARIRLGQIAMLSGDPERGIKELEAASAIEGAPMQADLALIAGYMRRNESAKALEAATALAKKLPREPIAFQVLGAVQAARKDFAAARASFAQALALDPTYLPAVQSLARLDLADRKPADARARFEAVLAKEPNNELALLGLADVMATTRAPAKEIVPVLQRAIAAKPNSAAARLALIRLYLQEKDGRAALTAAQEASVALPGDRRVLDALGLAQMAAGEHNQAIESFTRLAAQQPDSVQPLMRLAAAYASAKETDKSIDVLLRAQKLAPADPSIRRELALGYLTTGKVDQALSQARGLQSAAPKSASGFLLEGDIFAASLQWTQAERAYRDALKAEPASGVTVAKLHGALVAAGRKADADSMARKWLAEHPTEVGLRLYLAEQSLRVKDYKSAVSYYQVVVKEQPDNVAALNNLAWAAGQLGDPKAIGYAERALKLAPDSPLVLDTVGVLVAASGDANRGVEYLARAVTLAPDRPDIRFNYAKALMKAGKTEQARKELTQLQAVEQDFSGKSEVAGLLKQLP